MMRRKYLLGIFLSALCSCDYYDFRLKIIIHTGRSIAVDTYPEIHPDYPSINQREYYLREKVEPGDTAELMEIGENG